MPEMVKKEKNKVPAGWSNPKSLAYYHIRYFPIYYRIYYAK